jgi:hypothetical protein
MEGTLRLSGRLTARKIVAKKDWGYILRNTLRPTWLWWAGLFHVAKASSRATGFPIFLGRLSAVLVKDGQRHNLGVLCHRVVTTAFVSYVVDQLQTETSTFGDFKFHDSGVGTTDPLIGDTTIETTDGESRATGSQTETSATVYKSVGTISYTTTKAITEHGLFNDASAGTLMDRSEFAAINVVSGDSIEFTYELTCQAGG